MKANGWTQAKCRERMRGCLVGIREVKQRGGSAVWTYRFLFVRMYRQAKAMLFALRKEGLE